MDSAPEVALTSPVVRLGIDTTPALVMCRRSTHADPVYVAITASALGAPPGRPLPYATALVGVASIHAWKVAAYDANGIATTGAATVPSPTFSPPAMMATRSPVEPIASRIRKRAAPTLKSPSVQ